MTFEELEYKYLKALDDLISVQEDYLKLRSKFDLVILEKGKLEKEIENLRRNNDEQMWNVC